MNKIGMNAAEAKNVVTSIATGNYTPEDKTLAKKWLGYYWEWKLEKDTSMQDAIYDFLAITFRTIYECAEELPPEEPEEFPPLTGIYARAWEYQAGW